MDCFWSIIFWKVSLGVWTILLLYLTLGPALIHGKPEFYLDGNYCGPDWCAGKAESEQTCVQLHDWDQVPAEEGNCLDACCRVHDFCCGEDLERDQCNSRILRCLSQCPWSLKKAIVWAAFTLRGDACCGTACPTGPCDLDKCKSVIDRCNETCVDSSTKACEECIGSDDFYCHNCFQPITILDLVGKWVLNQKETEIIYLNPDATATWESPNYPAHALGNITLINPKIRLLQVSWPTLSKTFTLSFSYDQMSFQGKDQDGAEIRLDRGESKWKTDYKF